MTSKFFSALLCCAVLVSTPLVPARAQEEAQEEVRNEQKEIVVDYKKLETTGLYRSSEDGSLGRDLWANAKRSEILPLIRALPDRAKTPVMQRLLFGVLLTAADAGKIENDIPPQPGEDLLTLRLEKLIEAGAYDKAFEMYALLEETPYHANLAKAGTLAMLYSGEKSVACLEAHAFEGQRNNDDFWTGFLAYCDVSLSEGADEEAQSDLEAATSATIAALATQDDYRLTYNIKSYENLSPLEQALVATENKLDVSGLDDINPADIPPNHLLPLLMQNSLSDKNRLVLSVQAANWGLLSTKDLKDLYAAMSNPASGGGNEDVAASMPGKDWEKIPYFFHMIENAPSDDEKWALIRESYPLGRKLGLSALGPMAQIVQSARPAEATLQDTAMAYDIFNANSIKIPPYWIEKTREIEETAEEDTAYLPILTAGAMTASGTRDVKSFTQKITSQLQKAPPKEQEFYKNIIENIDKPDPGNHNADKVYEKDFYLTFRKDYVMPTGYLWQYIVEAGKDDTASKVILSGIAILSDQALRDTYPKLLQDVLQSFESVGLTHISREIAIAALLEDIKNN